MGSISFGFSELIDELVTVDAVLDVVVVLDDEDEVAGGVTTTTGGFFDVELELSERSGLLSIFGKGPCSVSPLPYLMPRLALNAEIIDLNVLLIGTVSL